MQNKSANEKSTAEVLDLPADNSDPQLRKNQKIAVIVLGFFSLLVLILMAVQFHHNISAPFAYSIIGTTTLATSQDPNSIDALKNKDTDGDGLSDYDEIYVYHTSPYLVDTDGDGFSDYEEVKNGTDPNCPAGQTCTSSPLTDQNQAADSGTSSTTASIYTGLGGNGGTTNSSDLSVGSSTDSALMQSMLSGTTDPKTLRQLLLQGGMDQATLDKISDADLLESYQETLNQNQSASNSSDVGQ